MKTLLAILVLIGTPLYVHAEGDDSFDLDLGPASSQDIGTESEDLSPSTGLKAEAKQNRSIYIVNQASSGAKADAESKTEQNDTTVMGSRAGELRKNRQRAELETELRATEKIEESRLSDERRRSDILFGDRYKQLEESGRQEKSAPTPVYIPVQVPSESIEHQSVTKEGDVHRKASTPTSTYFIGMAGLTEFPKADNIQGNGTIGIGLGVEAQEKLLVEGMFQYASYRSTYPWPSDIDEYSGVGALKFQFSRGAFRPLAGLTAVYSYRTYTDQFTVGNRQAHSSVLDVGALGGGQFNITEDFAIGAEFRYLWNVTSKTDGFYTTLFPNQQPLDNFSHYIFALTTRFNF